MKESVKDELRDAGRDIGAKVAMGLFDRFIGWIKTRPLKRRRAERRARSSRKGG